MKQKNMTKEEKEIDDLLVVAIHAIEAYRKSKHHAMLCAAWGKVEDALELTHRYNIS